MTGWELFLMTTGIGCVTGLFFRLIDLIERR